MKRLLSISLVVVVVAGSFWFLTQRNVQTGASTITFADGDTSGFARALEPRQFRFPQDHGPHFDYQTEWWYYTGNLQTEDGQHFGYQLTFFRRGLTPGVPPQDPGLATNQIYFAHFALTDVAGDKHTFAERFSRGAAGLAGATGEPFGLWLEDWRAESLSPDGSAVRLRANEGEIALDLTLRAVKPIVAHGDGGLSPKSEEPGNASYYLSFTRMVTTGQVTVRGQTANVGGESWFDHEWSTSALGPKALGWDWFSLQLSDGRELMFFQIRREDGTVEPVSGGTLIEKDGRTRRLSVAEVTITVTNTWASPETNASYPARWTISIPSAQIELTVEPWIASQEMRVSFPYWEGAVRLRGSSGGLPVTGNGYIELTGYVRTMQGVF
jgi:predicted secreted hydrolase